MSALTEIIFRLFAWVRPLLWYTHRIGHVLEAFLMSLERPSVVERVRSDPVRRMLWAKIILDLEHGLDIAIGLRTRELLGHPVQPETRPGLKQSRLIRLYRAPDFQALLLRLSRLIERYYDLERLAQLRAARLRRAADAAPVLMVREHRPANPLALLLVLLSFFIFARAAAIVPAGLRIRAPP